MGRSIASLMLAGLISAIPPGHHSLFKAREIGWRASNRRCRFDPRVNVHTGGPHEHKREIARNLRREARRASK